jgi:hypothetical protein
MTTLDDLRRALERHAALAPDATGLVEAARAGAVRIHRRRRITAIVTAAVVGVAAAVAVPVTWRLHAAPVAPAVPGPHVPVGRKAQEMTLGIDPGFEKLIVYRVASDDRQRIDLQQRSGWTIVFSASVEAYEPWLAKLSTRLPSHATVEQITVAGHAAEYVTEPLTNQGWFSAVQWIDPTGVSVRVTRNSSTVDRAWLIALAAATHLGPAHPLLLPFQIARIPTGTQVVSATVSTYPADRTRAALSLSSPEKFNVQMLSIDAQDKEPLELVAGPWGRPTPVAPIGDRRAWIAAKDPTRASSPPERNLDSLIVDAGSYWAIFRSSPDVSAEQVRQLASSTTFVAVADRSSWLPPVG